MEALGIHRKRLGATIDRTLSEVAGSYTYFADNDVLLAKITPCFENGKLGIASELTNGVGFGSSEYIVLRPSASLKADFLYYFLLQDSFRNAGAKSMTGAAGQKRVTKTYVESQQIPVPPLREQERIVAILNDAFDGIAKARTNASTNGKNARSIFESQLQLAFARPKELAALSELAIDITDGDHSPPPKADSGIPFITISNILKETRRIDFSDTFMVSVDYYERLKPNRKPRQGDVLYTVTGATLGIQVQVDHETRFCFQRHIGLIRPRSGVDSCWLSYALLSPQAFRQATEGSTGAAQKTVSLSVLRNLKVPRLTESEQLVQASRLAQLEDEMRRLVAAYSSKIRALDALKQSLLHQAFTGKL